MNLPIEKNTHTHQIPERLDYSQVAPEGYRAMLTLNNYTKHCGLEPTLLELIKVRAAQLNGCAYCLDMHAKDARLVGETEQRLYALSAWHETPFFTERERAALEWTEAVTRVGESHVPDAVYELARRFFTEKELVDLTWALVVINGWNRVAVAFRTVPGSYQPTPR